MTIRNLVLGLGFLIASLSVAQGPLYDRVKVTLPYPVSVNGTVLPAGDYDIRQHESAAGGSRVLHFFSDGGLKLETTAMAIPTVDNRTPEETKLVLEHIGSDYILNKVWVQGKDYAYEFPIPDTIRLRERERSAPTTVSARYEAAAPPVETAQNTAPAAPVEAPAAAAPAPAPAPAPVEQAQTQPAPAPVEAAPAPAPTPEPSAAAPAPTEMAADRGSRTMPHTAGNWLNLLLGGGLLTSSGLALRRFRSL